MASYRIPKDMSTELKINKWMYLTDFLLLIGLIPFTMVMSNLVHGNLIWGFYAFMLLLALLLIIRPTSNPKRRIYQAVYYAIMRRKDTYTAIDYSPVDEPDDTERSES